jgi:hypothetical protein
MNPYSQHFINLGTPNNQATPKTQLPRTGSKLGSSFKKTTEKGGSENTLILKKENAILRKEINKLNSQLHSKVIADVEVERLTKIAKNLKFHLEEKYEQTVSISDEYSRLVEDAQNQKDRLRDLVDQKIVNINSNLETISDVIADCGERLKSTNFEIIREKVHEQIEEINQKILEFEHILRESQMAYRQRLDKILATRRQAEINFLEERKNFAEVVTDLEEAYVNREDAYKERIDKEYKLIEENYFQLKHENCKNPLTNFPLYFLRHFDPKK